MSVPKHTRPDQNDQKDIFTKFQVYIGVLNPISYFFNHQIILKLIQRLLVPFLCHEKTVYLECFVFKLINYYLRRTSLCSNSKLDFGDFVMTHSVGSTILSGTFDVPEHFKIFKKFKRFRIFRNV